MSVPQSLIVRTLAFSLLAALSCAPGGRHRLHAQRARVRRNEERHLHPLRKHLHVRDEKPRGLALHGGGQCDAQTLFAQDPRVHAGRQRHLP